MLFFSTVKMTRGEYDVNNDNRGSGSGVENTPPNFQELSLKQRKNGDVLHDDRSKVESIEIDSSKEKTYVGYGFTQVQTWIFLCFCYLTNATFGLISAVVMQFFSQKLAKKLQKLWN